MDENDHIGTENQNWSIKFIGRSEHLIEDFLKMALCFFSAGALIAVMVCTDSDVGGIFLILLPAPIFIFLLIGMIQIPWTSVLIEKFDNQLVLTNWSGLLRTRNKYNLTEIKAWYYSERMKQLDLRLPYPHKHNADIDHIDYAISLKGISEHDLSFILKWFESNFERDPSLESN